jgi:hypothetical protein
MDTLVTTGVVEEQLDRDPYDVCNSLWPDIIPAISRVEAERAAKRLWVHFVDKHPPSYVRKARRCWLSPKPVTNVARNRDKGWHRLVHDVSHIAHDRQSASKSHGGWHAEREIAMVRYVLAQGWLDGRLKPTTRPKAKPPIQAERHQAILVRIKRWETKKRRAETALKKLVRQRRYYERQEVVQ